MTIEVSVRELEGATEISLRGLVDRDVLGRVGEAVRAVAQSDKAVILNLDDLVLVDHEAFDTLVAPFLPAGGFTGSVSVVCGSDTASQLQRWGVDKVLAIHSRIEEALSHARERTRGSGVAE